MALFTPKNQLRNMLDAEIGQALCGRADIGKMIALNSMLNQPQHQPGLHQQQNIGVNWMNDNWLNDDWLSL